MSDKTKGIVQKYQVIKLTNPEKKMDCVVLEFDDPLSQKGILAFARAVRGAGYLRLAEELIKKIRDYRAAAGEQNPKEKVYSDKKRIPGNPNYYRAEGSGKIYYKDPYLGSFSTGETTILRAKAVVNERRGQMLHGKSLAQARREGKRITNPLISEIWQTEVIDEKLKISKPNTMKNYYKTWKVSLEPFFKGKTVKYLAEDRTLIDYKNWYIEEFPERLVERTVVHLKILIRICFDQKLILQLPNFKPLDDLVEFIDVKSNREKHRRVFDELTEVQPLLKASKVVSRYDYLCQRIHLAILVGVRNGLRKGEILALKWTDINLDLDELSIKVIGEKNSTRRTNYMAEEQLVIETWNVWHAAAGYICEVKTHMPHDLEDGYTVRAFIDGLEFRSLAEVVDGKLLRFVVDKDFSKAAGEKEKRDRMNFIVKSCYMREQFLKQKTFTGKSEYVFPGVKNGSTKISTQVLDKMWIETKKLAKISDHPVPGWFHDLRRTCATRLIQSGTPRDEVSKMLDHSEQELKETYQVLTKQQKNNSEKMNEFLKKQGENVNKKSSS